MTILFFLLDIIDSPEELAKNKFQYVLLLIFGKPLAVFLAAIWVCIMFGWYVTFFGSFFILESFYEGNGVIGGLILFFNLVMLFRYLKFKLNDWNLNIREL